MVEGNILLPCEFITKNLVDELEFYANFRYDAIKVIVDFANKDIDKLIDISKTLDMEKLQNEEGERLVKIDWD